MYSPQVVREVSGVARFYGTQGIKIIMITLNRSYEL
jgi:hypothetical protein